MNKHRQFPLIIFIISLLTVSLACQLTAVSPETQNNDAIVAEVVATIQAQTAGSAADGETAVSNLVSSDANLEDKFTAVYQAANPAVVHIFVYEKFEDQVFPLRTGSAFLIDNQGHIVTNNHVIADGESFEVVYANGQRSHAEVIGTEEFYEYISDYNIA